jgi:hypothetical protein
MEIKDVKYLDTIHVMGEELQSNNIEYNFLASGETEKEKIVALRLEQNERLDELIKKHRRVLRFHAGLPVEPEVHYGEAVLFGLGGDT